MDAAGPYIPNLGNEVLSEGMLHTQVPVDRIGPLDVRWYPSRSVCASRSLVEYLNARTASRQSTTGEEARCLAAQVDVIRCADLWRHRQNADVVIQDVISHAEPRANRRVAAASGRVGDTNARSPIVPGGARCIEQQALVDATRHKNAWGVGQGIQRLFRLAARNRGVFVTYSKIQRQVRPQFPVIVRIPVDCLLVSVVRHRSLTALAEEIRGEIFQEEARGIVLIVTALTLSEALR